MCEYEQRNLAIIEAVMLDLGVSDIEELPVRVHEIVSRQTPRALDFEACPAYVHDFLRDKAGHACCFHCGERLQSQ